MENSYLKKRVKKINDETYFDQFNLEVKNQTVQTQMFFSNIKVREFICSMFYLLLYILTILYEYCKC